MLRCCFGSWVSGLSASSSAAVEPLFRSFCPIVLVVFVNNNIILSRNFQISYYKMHIEENCSRLSQLSFAALCRRALVFKHAAVHVFVFIVYFRIVYRASCKGLLLGRLRLFAVTLHFFGVSHMSMHGSLLMWPGIRKSLACLERHCCGVACPELRLGQRLECGRDGIE